MLLEQRVVDVMAGIALVAGEIDRAIDRDRQIRVDLDHAGEVALVPVVGAPRFAGDVLDGERLAARERQMLDGAGAAALDRGAEHGVDLVARNHVSVPERRVAIDERARARQQPLERRRAPAWNSAVGLRRRLGVVEAHRLLVEREPFCPAASRAGLQPRPSVCRDSRDAAGSVRRRRTAAPRPQIWRRSADAVCVSSASATGAPVGFHAGLP